MGPEVLNLMEIIPPTTLHGGTTRLHIHTSLLGDNIPLLLYMITKNRTSLRCSQHQSIHWSTTYIGIQYTC